MQCYLHRTSTIKNKIKGQNGENAMIILDSPFHITFSSTSDLPKYACTGKCKKVWWPHDFKNDQTIGLCPMCKEGLTGASQGVHFKVISTAERNLTGADFEPFEELGSEDKETLKNLLKNGKTQIAHLSKVKNKFAMKAIQEWI